MDKLTDRLTILDVAVLLNIVQGQMIREGHSSKDHLKQIRECEMTLRKIAKEEKDANV